MVYRTDANYKAVEYNHDNDIMIRVYSVVIIVICVSVGHQIFYVYKSIITLLRHNL